MIISNDEKTHATYAHFTGPKLITNYAYEIGYLYKKLGPIIVEHPHFSSLSKLEFWGCLTEHLIKAIEIRPEIDFQSIKRELISYSIAIIKKWDTKYEANN